MKRSRLTRKTPLQAHKSLKRGEVRLRQQQALRRMSKAREEELEEHRFWRETIMAQGTCQAKELVPEVKCQGRHTAHHVWPKGMYPERRYDTTNGKRLCRAHHDWVHQRDPRRARELGLLR